MSLPVFPRYGVALQLTRAGMTPDQADLLAKAIDDRDEELSRYLRRMEEQLSTLTRRNRDLEEELKRERRQREGLSSNTEWLNIACFVLLNTAIVLVVLFI